LTIKIKRYITQQAFQRGISLPMQIAYATIHAPSTTTALASACSGDDRGKCAQKQKTKE
jgi:hypothetical protein